MQSAGVEHTQPKSQRSCFSCNLFLPCLLCTSSGNVSHLSLTFLTFLKTSSSIKREPQFVESNNSWLQGLVLALKLSETAAAWNKTADHSHTLLRSHHSQTQQRVRHSKNTAIHTCGEPTMANQLPPDGSPTSIEWMMEKKLHPTFQKPPLLADYRQVYSAHKSPCLLHAHIALSSNGFSTLIHLAPHSLNIDYITGGSRNPLDPNTTILLQNASPSRW